jgi:ankyrin repeat protein
MIKTRTSIYAAALALFLGDLGAQAQVPPTKQEIAAYTDIFAAVVRNDLDALRRHLREPLMALRADENGRTPLHVATFLKRREAIPILIRRGAKTGELDKQKYDPVTIAAVADDPQTLKVLLDNGASAKLITSIYDGTALIAAAHLGHETSVALLIRAGAPFDHVNNIGWTALMESIVLGNGGKRHQATLKLLLDAKANPNIPDRQGITPLTQARNRGYAEMVKMLEAAGAI